MWDEELRKLFEEQDPEADAEYRVMLQWDEVHLHASIPACLVKASRYSIVFDISIDSNGNPWHFNILAPASSCSEILSSRGPSAPKRGARVELQRVKYAFRPVLIQQQAELHQDIQTQKSPLQKYWYVDFFPFLDHCNTAQLALTHINLGFTWFSVWPSCLATSSYSRSLVLNILTRRQWILPKKDKRNCASILCVDD